VIRGYAEYYGRLSGMNTLSGGRKGKVIYYFQDGGFITTDEPSEVEVGGIMVGPCVAFFKGKKYFYDL
jgi:hypothetical protein